MLRPTLLASALFALALSAAPAPAQHSVARQWNDVLLEAIRGDFARPTVHARNLFHTSIALYDAWAVYGDGPEQTYLLGKTVGGFTCSFSGVPRPDDVEAARREAMSYAAARLLRFRFRPSPGWTQSFSQNQPTHGGIGLQYDLSLHRLRRRQPRGLGQLHRPMPDGFWDAGRIPTSAVPHYGNYGNRFYMPFNRPLDPTLPGPSGLLDPNFWQPLRLEEFIDQSGNVLPDAAQPFLGPEWGLVTPFALGPEDLTVYQREGHDYPVYHDPGPPPHIDSQQPAAADRIGELKPASEEYQWGFALVAAWSSHLDPADGVLWDISPGNIGNVAELPQTFAEYQAFYNLLEGGDAGQGHPLNPHTGQPYEEQWVPRGDYTRVLAEFWADGPETETPPGHWFTILNYVSDHPLFEKRFKGEGPILDDLEWDVKAYFALGGAVHDAAVSAWGIKGWYDYVRPISAIRWMADQGQSSDPDLPRYDPAGLPLMDGYIELVQADDPLAGENGEHIGKIKLRAWRGPSYIADPDADLAGVGWILAENWWPYQQPTFVTPPFAGYISGHSTFSRAAAEVLTLLTGDPFFPGGLGEFRAARNRFLAFEEGPSVDVVLQWATYRDAADQTSLSRIWGGIHPPADDIPGRAIGARIGVDAFALAEAYFGQPATAVAEEFTADRPSAFALSQNYPNPFNSSTAIAFDLPHQEAVELSVYTIAGQQVTTLVQRRPSCRTLSDNLGWPQRCGVALASGVYLYRLRIGAQVGDAENVVVALRVF